MKIKFFVPYPWTTELWMPSIYYMLRTAYDISGKHPELLTWQKSYFFDNSADVMYSAFEQDMPDIICLSIYLWNCDALHAFAKRVKDNHPNTVVILGGPDTHWQTHDQYMATHPYYDYIIYGDGEDAFPKLVDLITTDKANTMNLLNVPNLMFRDKQLKSYRTPHEVYRGAIYTEHSPWLHCVDEFIEDCKIARTYNVDIVVATETDRGCPYKCSFCDWSASLHNKVTKKNYSFTDEIYLFAEQGCIITFNNANFGMQDDDLHTLELVWTLIQSGKYPGLGLGKLSWAKLHKKKVHAIYEMEARITGKLHAKVALQSITPAVLENIDRPAVPWAEHKQLLLDLRKTLPTTTFELEVIVGLPGESFDTWNDMLYEFADLPASAEQEPFGPNLWYILPNSPAAKPEYMSKHKLDIRPTYIPVYAAADTEFNCTEDEIVKRMFDNDPDLAIQTNNVWGTYSAGVEDILYMLLSFGVMHWSKVATNGNPAAAKKLFASLIPKIQERVNKDGAKFRQYYEQYGSMTFYVYNKNRLFTYDVACKSFPMEMLKS